jgi:hypothetical protein
MLYQSVANSVSGIIAQITDQNEIWWAGPVTTLILFLFSGIGALYNCYIGRMKYRYAMTIGASGYIIYCASAIVFVSVNVKKSIGFIVAASLVNVIGGLILSMFYICQFNYISECSIADNRPMYFGINMGIVQSANIFGSILSAYTV